MFEWVRTALKCIPKIAKKVQRFFFRKDDYSGLIPLTEREYEERFQKLSDEQRLRAFEMVLDTRKFEIEMYWKRATYFWAFIASAFAGYIFLVRAGAENQFFGLVVICIGLVLSFAWLFTNLGSKTWQRHWEKHLDLLEDQFVGPLYKTVNSRKTFSVSKINGIVSGVFCAAWVLMGIDHLQKNGSLYLSFDIGDADFLIWIALLGAFAAIFAMVFGYGRGRFGLQQTQMFKRIVKYQEVDEVLKLKMKFEEHDKSK
ncbi:hypothetical protein PUV54_09895 [Hyphococcus flavus]|uniref:Uncharacterized protein n=1 Tax=Hyphococcus flavus TaxID=1866326 RepID=A0AAE9ZHG1_9PROT|nr:hypothetical protein [Hyphococcus flavus]WDI30270.1 hypothetical protein PUV54_09895 [Hyphococcus flavus]